MLTGGMRLVPLEPKKRQKLGLAENQMALLVQHLGQYGAHAAAKRAGIKKGDVLISYAGRSDLTTESLLMAESINRHQTGDRVRVTLLRGDNKKEFQIPIQP